MLDFNAFIFICVAVSFGMVGMVVWVADSGISDKYKSLLTYFMLAIALGLAGLFFMIDDDSQFEYAGYEKMKAAKGGKGRGSMVEEGGGGGGGGATQEQANGDSDDADVDEEKVEKLAEEKPEKIQDCSYCPEMVVISPGMALLGSTRRISSGGLKSGPAAQKNFHRSFSIGKYEVTLGEFQKFIDDVNYTPSDSCRRSVGKGKGGNYLSPGFAQLPRNPVVCVNWTDASRYTVWLSAKTGKSYRLPTEAEWEYAARAGITQTYMTGEELSARVANFRAGGPNSGTGTRQVGSYASNSNNMFDVHGNVWEIVGDCWSKHYQVAENGSAAGAGAIDCSRRIVKGGGWASPVKQAGFPMRGAIPFDMAVDGVGFRVMHD